MTNFSRKTDQFIQSIKSNYHILKDDGDIVNIFAQLPKYASEQPPNLRQEYYY